MSDPLGLFTDDSNKDPLGLFADEEPKKMEMSATENPLVGGLEGAASMVAGIPSQIAGGLKGLNELALGHGLDAAANTVKKTQEDNFGLGAYKPVTKTGQYYSDIIGKAFSKPGEWAGQGAQALGLDPIYGQLPVDAAMNFLPIHGIGKGIKGVLEAKPKAAPRDIISELDKNTPVPNADPLNLFTQGDLFPDHEGPLTNRATDPQSLAEMRGAADGQQDLFGGAQNQVTNEPMRGVVPNDQTVARPPIDTESQHPLFDQPEQGRIANPYEATTGDWRVDENGMTIKADLSMDVQGASDPLQRGLWGDELPPKHEQEQTPITQALDSMPDLPWKNEKDTALDSLTGDVPADGSLQAAVGEANSPFSTPDVPAGPRPKFIAPRGQRGSTPMIGDLAEKLFGKGLPGLSPKEKMVTDILGQKNFIPKGDAPQDIIQQALANGKDGAKSVWSQMQSGLLQTADKVDSPAMLGVGRWLAYGNKLADHYNRVITRPVEQAFNRLNDTEHVNVSKLMKAEFMDGKTYPPEQLAKVLNKKELDAYTQMRNGFKQALDLTNDGRQRLGQKPITPENAYLASKWNGNWHVPILDSEGKLAWYLRMDTRSEANKAIAWLKENGPKDLDYSQAEAKYHPNNVGSKMPRDVLGAYQDMLQFFDGDTAKQMKSAMDEYTQAQGYKFQGFNKHFQQKTGVRGYEGDRPWLSPEKNAMAQTKAQVEYLKDAMRWAPMNEALGNVKEVLSSPELNKQQPHNMDLIKQYTAQQLGISQNMFKAVENTIQKGLSAVPGGKLTGNVGAFVHSMKDMTYLQQLGLSAGYMIATPLQSLLLGPSLHMRLSGQGFSHNPLMTGMKATADFLGGLVGKPVSKLGQAAFDYMHDNGVISQNIFSDNNRIGGYKPVEMLKKGIGSTISYPEKIARAATFMSFAHHLDASGKFTDQGAMFRKAEEMTNNTLTEFHRSARPLIVDKLGQIGETAYTYKSPLFNTYNNLSTFARDAVKGKPGPLITALAMTQLMSGAMGLPGVNELDMAWNAAKDMVAKEFPALYPKIKDFGIKESIVKNMPDYAAYGVVSKAIGAQMSNRFSSSMGELTNPMANLAPVVQEGKEMGGLAEGVMHHESTKMTQGVYNNVPPSVKGLMENNMDAFKGPKQGANQNVISPTDLMSGRTVYSRTPQEQTLRNFGLTSLAESQTKNNRFLNGMESARLDTARDSSMDELFNAVRKGDKADIQKYALAFVGNEGDGQMLQSGLQKKVEAMALTPEQLQLVKATSLHAVMNAQRMLNLQKNTGK